MTDKMRSEFEEWWRAERAAMNPPAYVTDSAWITWQACAARTVPDGFVVVPVEPTQEMLDSTSWPRCAETDYKHMLKAAPEPELKK